MEVRLASIAPKIHTSCGLRQITLRRCIALDKCISNRISAACLSPSSSLRRGLYTTSLNDSLSYTGSNPFILSSSNRVVGTTLQTFKHEYFSPPKMAPSKIDGTAIAKEIRERLKAEVSKLREADPTFRPSLTIVQGSEQAYTSKHCVRGNKYADPSPIQLVVEQTQVCILNFDFGAFLNFLI